MTTRGAKDFLVHLSSTSRGDHGTRGVRDPVALAGEEHRVPALPELMPSMPGRDSGAQERGLNRQFYLCSPNTRVVGSPAMFRPSVIRALLTRYVLLYAKNCWG